MIAVVNNTGGTNLNSVCHALRRLEARFIVTGDAAVIRSADKVILPGVGAAAHAMDRLQESNLVETLRQLQQPVLGICLGMQLLFERSEEGDVDCLGIIPAKVTSIPQDSPSRRIPHMGWNALENFTSDFALCRGLPDKPYVYFVHSFAAESGEFVRATSQYGISVPAIVQYNNFFGCQFHPEKSALTGARILKNFIEMES